MDPEMLAKIQAMPDGPLKTEFLRYAAMKGGATSGGLPSTADAVADTASTALAAVNPTGYGAAPASAAGVSAPMVSGAGPAAAVSGGFAPPTPAPQPMNATSGATATPKKTDWKTAQTLGAIALAPAGLAPAAAIPVVGSLIGSRAGEIVHDRPLMTPVNPSIDAPQMVAPNAYAKPEGPPQGSPQMASDIDTLHAHGVIGEDTAKRMKEKLAADAAAKETRENSDFAKKTDEAYRREKGLDEKAFQAWYQPLAKKYGIDQNPDAPEHKYDYRAAYRAGEGPDATGHWPSSHKAADHPRRYLPINGVLTDTATMQPVTGATPTQDTRGGSAPQAVNTSSAPPGSWLSAVHAAYGQTRGT